MANKFLSHRVYLHIMKMYFHLVKILKAKIATRMQRHATEFREQVHAVSSEFAILNNISNIVKVQGKIVH